MKDRRSIGGERDELRPPVEDIEFEGSTDADEIEKAWRAFIEDGVDPHLSVAVKPEVADSWVRCKAMGVDPFAEKLSVPVDDECFNHVLDLYRPLIEATRPLMGIIDDLGLADDYVFELISPNGMSLLSVGNLGLHPYIARRDIFDERTCGTNAHSLCMSCKTPIQLVGYEHYCEALHGLSAEAAPIADENGMVIAALLLTRPLASRTITPTYHKVLSHALGLVASIASAVEQRMRVVRVAADLEGMGQRYLEAQMDSEKTKNMLALTVGSSSDPILLANADGVILQASPGAAHLIGRSSIDLEGSTIAAVFGVSWAGVFGKLMTGERTASVKVQVRGRQFFLRGNVVPGSAAERGGDVLLRLEERRRRQAGSGASISGEAALVTFDDILGKSRQIIAAVSAARRYAATNENVLIVGESGTGKELFAQAIHNASRPDGPFMALNCAAIPPRLIESELFGYEGGAFTGAERGGKAGKIELANGGTLFLDEIGDMPVELQATLLRVLENKRVMRLGGKVYKQVDFRVVAATNRDLVTMVRSGTFREDLLYRLSILTVELPPLREREGDALLFARLYLDECQRRAPGGPNGFTPLAEKFITGYGWPGNVRQMKNAVYSAYYATENQRIDVDDFPTYVLRTFERINASGSAMRDTGDVCDARLGPFDGKPAASGRSRAFSPWSEAERMAVGRPDDSSNPSAAAEQDSDDLMKAIEHMPHALSMAQAEQSAIKLAMRQAEGNVRRASELLGISKATLYRKLKEFGLE